MSQQFTVRVYGPKELIYEGEVWAISSVNDKGPFDVLALHTNFITVIKDKVLLHFDQKNFRFLPAEYGVLRCFEQGVDVYLGIKSKELIEATKQ